ncbi:antitoxin VapB family protein [Haloparvum sedimenti]
MAEDTTTVTVSKETWKQLHLRKGPGDSFDDVIQELLEESENSEE